MSILVLGGTRYVGPLLLKELLKTSSEITIVSRGNYPNPFPEHVQSIIADRNDSKEMEEISHSKTWETIYDLSCYEVKSATTATDLAKNCTRYILASTQAVYGKGKFVKEEQIDLDNSTNTLSDLYARQKLEIEKTFHTLIKDKLKILRFPMILGVTDFNRRLQFYLEHNRNQQAIACKKPNDVFSIISSQEAALCLAHAEHTNTSGAVNCASLGSINHTTIFSMIEESTQKAFLLNANAKVAPLERRESLTLDTSKAQSLAFPLKSSRDSLRGLIDEMNNSYEKQNC